jgi:hypothetical protein
MNTRYVIVAARLGRARQGRARARREACQRLRDGADEQGARLSGNVWQVEYGRIRAHERVQSVVRAKVDLGMQVPREPCELFARTRGVAGVPGATVFSTNLQSY